MGEGRDAVIPRDLLPGPRNRYFTPQGGCERPTSPLIFEVEIESVCLLEVNTGRLRLWTLLRPRSVPESSRSTEGVDHVGVSRVVPVLVDRGSTPDVWGRRVDRVHPDRKVDGPVIRGLNWFSS